MTYLPQRLVALLLILCLCLPSTAFAQAIPGGLPLKPPSARATSPTVNTGKVRATGKVDKSEDDDERAPREPRDEQLTPYGANLFKGNFNKTREDGLNPNYVIMPGDHVAMNIWGAIELSDVFVVDGQGNIFIPQVGPVHLAGTKNAELTETVRKGLSRVYTRYFDVYTNLITAKPVAVYVTGGVERPGRYAGTPNDSALFFLDQAGGIEADLGSYRDIVVLRGGKEVASIDLYNFLQQGKMPTPQFEDGDTILVRHRGPTIEVRGSVARPSLLEFKGKSLRGKDALAMIPQAARATEVTVVGIRKSRMRSQTLSVNSFMDFELIAGDRIRIREEDNPATVLVRVEGEYEGATTLAVRRGSRLVDVLHHIRVDPRLANVRGVHIRRVSVATAQKDSIDDALFRLERSALLALSDSDGETNIRVKEAELVQRFVERARQIQPLGRVVTSRQGKQLNVLLEDGDTIVVPRKTNIVRVSGEVFMAQAIMYTPGMTAGDYIKEAGGLSERAHHGKVVVHHPNAQVEVGGMNTVILPGDEILVPPRVDTKVTQAILDITQIIYQVAVSAAVIVLLAT